MKAEKPLETKTAKDSGVQNCNEEEANDSGPEKMTMPMTLMSVDGHEREKGEVLSLYGLKTSRGGAHIRKGW